MKRTRSEIKEDIHKKVPVESTLPTYPKHHWMYVLSDIVESGASIEQAKQQFYNIDFGTWCDAIPTKKDFETHTLMFDEYKCS